MCARHTLAHLGIPDSLPTLTAYPRSGVLSTARLEAQGKIIAHTYTDAKIRD